MGFTPFVAGAYLEAATKAQCSTQDWPAEMHAAHMEFCKEYGYSTNSN